MPKLFLAVLLLLTTTVAPACDSTDESPPDPPQFREGINAEFPALEYVSKILACIEVERPVTVTLVEADIYNNGTQSFSLLLESTAPVDQVDCVRDILEANQP